MNILDQMKLASSLQDLANSSYVKAMAEMKPVKAPYYSLKPCDTVPMLDGKISHIILEKIPEKIWNKHIMFISLQYETQIHI